MLLFLLKISLILKLIINIDLKIVNVGLIKRVLDLCGDSLLLLCAMTN